MARRKDTQKPDMFRPARKIPLLMSMATAPSVFSEPPANLPSQSEIVALCREVGYNNSRIFYADASGVVLAWVKYGPNVTMDEAHTQAWFATYLDTHPEASVKAPHVFAVFTSFHHPIWPIGHIVMEYIDAPDCTVSDHEQVVGAVDMIIHIEAPSDVPGHYGGGAAVHSLFNEWRLVSSTRRARSSKVILTAYVSTSFRARLEDTRSWNILVCGGDVKRVSFENEKLYLCPVNINAGNFKLLEDRIVALDFRATCFLPASFITYALRNWTCEFTWKVASHVKYLQSTNLKAMAVASYYPTVYERNDIGQLASFRFT